MKTEAAIQTHLVLALCNAAAGGWIHEWWGQILVQAMLLIIHGVVAHLNSYSNPDGTPIEADKPRAAAGGEQ